MKKLSLYTLLLALLALVGRPAQAQQFEWAKHAHKLTTWGSSSLAAATDLDGNTYSAMGFRDSMQVGSQVFRGPASILVKYDSLGQVQWIKRFTGMRIEYNGLVADKLNGGVFFVGSVDAPATWDGSPVSNLAVGDFYAKCSPTGTLLWSSNTPDPSVFLRPLSADGLGNFYIITRMSTAGTFQGLAFNASDVALQQITSTGTMGWVRRIGSVPDTAGWVGGAGYNIGLSQRLNGGCLVFGVTQQGTRAITYGTTAPAPVVTSSTRGGSPFLLNIDVTGTLQWGQLLESGTPGTATYSALRVQEAVTDLAGNVYVSGNGSGNGSSAAGPQLTKFSPTGTQLWSQRGNNGQSYSNGDGYWLAVAPNGQHITVTISEDQPTTFAGLRLKALRSIVRLDGQGNGLWAVSEDIQPRISLYGGSGTGISPYFQNHSLGLDRRGNIYCAGQLPSTWFNPVPYLTLGTHTIVGDGMFVTKINNLHDIITGRVYLDANNNGMRDAGEVDFPRQVVLEAVQPGGRNLGTSATIGSYKMMVDSGAYSLSIPNVPLHYTVSQPSTSGGTYSGRFASYGLTDSLRHFGLHPVANQPDLRASLTFYSAVRRGVPNRLRLTLENVGPTATTAGTATITLDPRALFISSSPNGTFNSTTHQITVSYTALASMAHLDFDVLYSLPTTIALSTNITMSAQAPVGNDLVPGDNSASVETPVIGSFDPNDITVNYSRLTPTQVASAQPLDYVVRFHNMGTDTAFVVFIHDTLDYRKLDLTSIELVAQSHNCMWTITNRGILTIRFLNIRLPHNNIDVIRSQGFVRFRLRPRTSLALGDIIPNRAHIFFDFNAPVTTNTATTAILLPTAVLHGHEAQAWAAYPNPTTDALTIDAELPTAGAVRLQLLDMLGRPVQQRQLQAPAGAFRQTLDLSTQAPGLYVLRLTLPDGRSSTRTVERK